MDDEANEAAPGSSDPDALRRRMEELENLFVGFMNHLPGAAFIKDRESRLLWVNQYARDVFGAEDAIGKTALEHLPREVAEPMIADEREALKSGPLVKTEVVSLKDGTERIYRTVRFPIRQPNRPDLLGGISFDITEYKRTLDALRKNEALYRSIVEHSHTGILIVGEDYRFVYVNDRLAQMLDYAVDELIGTDFREYLDEESRALVADRYIRRQRGEDVPSRYEFNVIRRDGSKRRVEISSTVIKNSNGGVRTVAQILDITDRKRFEEELRASEAKYRDLFESSRDVIYISSPEGEIIDINPAAEELFGYTRAEMLGMDAHRLYADPTARERFSRTIKERGFVRDFEVKFRRKDGGELDCLETAISRWNAEGDIVEYQGIIRDVTEQKKLQAQLVQAMQMESIGRLAGGIAHDFNNLLTVIIGCAELASYELSPHDPLREEIDEILKAADHARDLTRRLLAFSRKQMLEEKVLNINEIIANLDKMLRRILGEDLIYETVLASDLHPVKVDPGQIEDVIINLVINARDAMPRGGNLTIETANVYLDEMYTRTHREVIPGDYVMIAVTDTGCGISDEMLDRIFEPFFTTKQPGMGTGLGLSTAYGIVKQSRGYIFVYSEVGKGTTFKVYLPRVKEEPEELEEKVVPEGLPRGSETILVVEDEPGVLGMAERTLKRQGYEVLTAKNGGEAYLLCKQRERPVDLVLTDIVMPHMSGVQFVEQLRGIWPYIKVLYMSGYPAHAAINNGMLGPDAPFMMKPYSPRDLVLKVREVLDREAAG